MTITGQRHITATEKKHIREIIALGWTQANTARKAYKMEKTETGFSGVVCTKQRDSMNRPIVRKQSFTVVL
jgi:hypothetical protein